MTMLPLRRSLAVVLVAVMLCALVPASALALREGETTTTTTDDDGDGTPERYDVDWDGDGVTDETWHDFDEDGDIDAVEWNTGGDDTRSPRGTIGMRVHVAPLAQGGEQVAVDWDGDGFYDEVWWDYDGDGDIDDTDIFETESKVIDNTKATRFRGVFVGVKNGLDFPEKDVDDLTGALAGYGASWDAADMSKLKGAAATPAAIQAAIDAAKADSKPGDEFVFYFAGHGGGYDKDDGWSGGRLDTDGDEKAITIPESELGGFDGSDLATADPGWINYYGDDMDGDGTEDTRTVKDEHGNVTVERLIGGNWVTVGTDTDGDGDVDKDDGGVDLNGDGDKTDEVAFDDTLLVAGGASISDDQLVSWLSGFPESVTIVVILDSCYSGSFVPDLARVKDSAGKPLRPGHLEAITAAPADDEAYEAPISNGVLTQAILDALTVLPGALTGGHATSAADFIGDEDDRTTTRELFSWAGPSATTWTNLDNDADGTRNEDGPRHEIVHGSTVTHGSHTDPATGLITTFGHDEEDEDGDLKIDEDPDALIASFFDIYYDPAFDGEPVPTFMQTVATDRPLSVNGMSPAISIDSEVPLEVPADPAIPGDTLEVRLRQVPVTEEAAPPPGMAYASWTYDLTLTRIYQAPPLDEMLPGVIPTQIREEVANPNPFPMITVTMTPHEPGAAVPFFWEPTGGTWLAAPPVGPPDPETGAVTFVVPMLSQYALFRAGGSGHPADTTGPDAPYGLEAFSDGGVPQLAWHNPTDPDWADTALYREKVTPQGASAGVTERTLVVQTTDPFFRDEESLAPGWYTYTLHAYDDAGNETVGASSFVKVDSNPTAVDDAYETTEDVTLEVGAPGVLANDFDADGDIITEAQVAEDPLHGTVALDADGSFTYTPPNGFVGTDSFTYRAISGEDSDEGVVTIVVTEASGPELPGGVVRVAGTDRYLTAIEASKRAFPDGADTVVIATGANWPDALGGSALCGVVDGPLLLTRPDALPSAVATEIERLGATKAYVLGGTGAVAGAVEDELTSLLGGPQVERLAGLDRYGTAAAVADEVIGLLGAAYDGHAFIATGGNFPDALAASPLAAANGWPILLARPVTDTLALPEDVTEAAILGGTGAVSSAIEAAAEGALGEANVSRYGGLDRYATAKLVAEYGVDSGLSWDGVGVATGENFPDALSGGAMLGAYRSVMLLTRSASLHSDTQAALESHAEEIGTVFIIGGTGAISSEVESAVSVAAGIQ